MTIKKFPTAVATKPETVTLLVFLVLAAACLSGKVSPPAALGLGLLFAAAFETSCRRIIQSLSKHLLQVSVAGLGFGMNLSTLWESGREGFGIASLSILGTLLLGWWLGKLLKVESNTSLLISSGTSICGGSAIAAVGAVMRADPAAMSVALCTVFVLNSIALFVFPPMGAWLGLSQEQFGLWAAIAIHDTSSVVGAAASYGQQALQIAITVKLARTLWIIPLALGVAILRRRRTTLSTFPWFIGLFLLAATVRTVAPQGEPAYLLIKESAVIGLTLTLFLIGAGLSWSSFNAARARSMLQGILLWCVISTFALLVVLN